MALIVVTGPPVSGKSTWVLAHATTRDIVIDFDRLATALTGDGAHGHDHAGPVHAVTRKARQAAIDAALGYAAQVDVYVIHSTPSRARLDHYRQLGARVVVIDPGRDVVMGRCKAGRPHRMQVAAARWYEQRVGVDPVAAWDELAPGVTSRVW